MSLQKPRLAIFQLRHLSLSRLSLDCRQSTIWGWLLPLAASLTLNILLLSYRTWFTTVSGPLLYQPCSAWPQHHHNGAFLATLPSGLVSKFVSGWPQVAAKGHIRLAPLFMHSILEGIGLVNRRYQFSHQKTLHYYCSKGIQASRPPCHWSQLSDPRVVRISEEDKRKELRGLSEDYHHPLQRSD